ncbi:unnamed protein product [Gongylonema pulchrum]|uniref:Transposase n=1 Tax=Gongylonema pulchrum TaxID=637853 RepID=A0A183EIM0_9BILA|nr:unnamed protein product [Gongylonema pulchrum]
MKFGRDFAESVVFRKCRWVDNRCILCSSSTTGKKQKFEKGKYLLRDYAPHGRSISIKNDPAKVQDAATVALQLRAKGFVAYSTDNRILIGPAMMLDSIIKQIPPYVPC